MNELRNKRIAIVLSTLDLGGSERQALHLASYLQDQCRARVAVVALFGGLGGQPVRQMCIQRRLPCLRVNMPELAAGAPTARSIRQFARDLKFLQPQVLLPYTSLPNLLCGVVWRIIGASACIWNQRDEGIEFIPSRWQDTALKNVSHFIANSAGAAGFLTAKCGVAAERIELIHNGVSLPPPRSARETVRAALNLPQSCFVAVMLGNITRHKDHATLVRAWKIVCDRLPQLEPVLILAGREDHAEPLKQLIAELALERQVRLIGSVEDVPSFLHAADLSVFSSTSEGTPNAVLESMAAGLAVVASDIPGCREALGSEHPALVPPGDATAMASAIIDLALNDSRRQAVARACAMRAS